MQCLTLAAGLTSQALIFIHHSVRAIRDPADADAVSTVGEISSLGSLEYMKRAMMADAMGRAILRHRPRVTNDVLELAQSQPEGTFGHRYAAFMNHNHFLPSGRTPVRYIADPTLCYVMTRYRECHDFLHTITNCGRTVEEELAVKLLEWHHTGLPLGLLAIVGGAPHLTSAQRRRMKLHWEWASSNAPNCVHGERQTPLYLNVPWEELMGNSVEEVQNIAGIEPLDAYIATHGGRL